MNASATCTGAAPDASEANLAAAVTPPTSSALDVSSRDNKGWSLYGAPWLQPMAIGGKSGCAESRRNKRKPLPWVATGCRLERMVRRGSTVRVRQRALRKRLQIYDLSCPCRKRLSHAGTRGLYLGFPSDSCRPAFFARASLS